MTTLKTRANEGDVRTFLNSVTDEVKRRDSATILEIMTEITAEKPVMWGDSIIGFGRYHYRYESGREGDWFLTGFSPRKQNLALYIMSGFSEYEGLLKRLGKYKTGKACLYITKLADVDLEILRELIRQSVLAMRTS